MELRNKVLNFIGLMIGKRSDQLALSTELENDLQLDSIDRLDLIFKLENLLGIQLSTDQIEEVTTISDLCYQLEQSNNQVLQVF